MCYKVFFMHNILSDVQKLLHNQKTEGIKLLHQNVHVRTTKYTHGVLETGTQQSSLGVQRHIPKLDYKNLLSGLKLMVVH